MSDTPTRQPAPAPVVVDAPAVEHWHRHVTRQVLILLLLAGLIGLAYWLQDAWKLLGPAQRCWEFKEIDGKLYRVNPCTGQFQFIGDAVAPNAGK